jgi:cupredoxin-like protein
MIEAVPRRIGACVAAALLAAAAIGCTGARAEDAVNLSLTLKDQKFEPVGSEAIVYVRPLQPGRYNFFDDFHRATQGTLVVP